MKIAHLPLADSPYWSCAAQQACYASSQVHGQFRHTQLEVLTTASEHLWDKMIPVSILCKSISGRHRPVRVADGPMMARCRLRRMLAGIEQHHVKMWAASSKNVRSFCASAQQNVSSLLIQQYQNILEVDHEGLIRLHRCTICCFDLRSDSIVNNISVILNRLHRCKICCFDLRSESTINNITIFQPCWAAT